MKFLLDTGADLTSITLDNAIRLGLNVDKIITPENLKSINGIGGETKVYPISESIGFTFIDKSSYKKGTSSYHIEISDKINLIPTLPMNILGRDLLDRFDIEITTVPEKIELKRNDFCEGTHICFSL